MSNKNDKYFNFIEYKGDGFNIDRAMNSAFDDNFNMGKMNPFKTGGSVKKSFGGDIGVGTAPEFTGLKSGGMCHKKEGSEIKIKHPGALHRELGIPEGEKIPMKTLEKEKKIAKSEGDTRLMKRVVFAENFRGKK